MSRIRRSKISYSARGQGPQVAALVGAAALSATLLAAVPVGAAYAASGPTTVQVSVSTGGFGPDNGGNGGSRGTERRLLSDDGRYAVYESSGPVVPGQGPLDWQIVRRDRQLGTTELISRSTAGVKANGRSSNPSMSADGQTIAFVSDASNLVAGDTNGHNDVFVHDARTGVTSRVSVTSAGAQVTALGSGTNVMGPPSLSADGRYVGFATSVAGLAPGDSNMANAYLHDRASGTTEVVSLSHLGVAVDVSSMSTVSVSADGDVVSFYSGNASVVPGDTNGDPDVFVRNRSAGTTVMVPAGQEGVVRHAMTPDGRFVVFESATNNLVPGDTNGQQDIFVHDTQTSTVERVSLGSGRTEANGFSSMPAISNDGRYATFTSEATNLVPGDTNGEADVFLHDRVTGQTTRVSVAANGTQNSTSSRSPAISGDGQHVMFESHGRDLTSVNTKTWGQVFVRDLTGRWPALHARIDALPPRVAPNSTYRIATLDIRTGPALEITWTPAGGGAVVRQSAVVSGNAFVLRSPKKRGKYVVRVSYAGHEIGSRATNVLQPAIKPLPKALKRGKTLTVKTTGLNRGDKVKVTFKPVGSTRGKTINRRSAVNKKGVAKVKAAPRAGQYRVTVRADGKILGKAAMRLR